MADIADVESALVTLISGAIYPNGTGSPSAIVLANGSNPNCRIYAGWPIPANLDADMALGTPPGSAAVLNISVFAQPGLERNVTRYTRDWVDQFQVPSTFTLTVSNNMITISGSVTTGHYILIVVFNQAFSYAAVAGDTLSTVAAALAAMINAKMAAYAIGPVITIVNRSDITARTAAPGTVIQELKRQQRRFMISIWAPSNDARVAASRIVDPALAAVDFLSFPDTSQGRLIYENSNDMDRSTKISIMSRDLFYWVEYPTTLVMPGYPIATSQAQIGTADGSQAGSTCIQNS